MFSLKPSLAAAAVVAVGVLAAAGPASAKYQHGQTDVEYVQDGTSNTILFAQSARFN